MNDWIKLQDKEFANDEANAKRLIGIMSATRGLSPECVAACVAAVKVYREFGYKEARDLLNDAIALLPKEGT